MTSSSNPPDIKLVRLVRPSVVVLCGPAACGKSTFAARHFRPTQIVSSDWARAQVCDDERDQRFNTQAFALVHFLVEQRLGLNRLCVVDSTALTGPARQELLSLAKKRQVPTVAIVFDVPLETCVERDAKRERTVGRPVIERQYQAFDQVKAAIRQEGFDQVLELTDEDIARVQTEIVFRPVARPAQHPSRPNFAGTRRPARPFGVPPNGAAASATPATPMAPHSAERRPLSSPRPATASAGTAGNAAKPSVPVQPPPAGSQPVPKPAPDASVRPLGVSPVGKL